MAGMVTINSWDFYPDSPLGCTLGYNGPHGADIHFFQALIAYGGTRVRLNIKPDNYAANSMSASPSTWTWGFFDAVVLMANQNNIRCTLVVRGFTPSNNTTFASWQENNSCASGFTQTTIPGYTKMAVALARRYSGDGNPDNAKDGSGNALQADCIEIGNEEINSMQDSSGYPYTGCRKAMRYVKLVRDTLTQLRASSTSGGGGWVPRGNFQARVGAWGIVHDQPNEVTSTYGILTHPVLDATYNPSANASSIFGLDSVLGVQMLDYANIHNYNPSDGSGGLTPAAEVTQVRGILNSVGNTNIPIWVTEAGTDGPCNGVSEAAQAAYYAPNADGSGAGMLQALKTAGCQHWDVFTVNYWETQNGSGGKYIGQPMSIACLTTASGTPPNSYVQFQALARIAAFNANQDQGAWAAQAIPKGFGTQSGGGGGGGGPTLTTIATDTFANRSVNPGWGASSDGTSGSWVSFTEPASGGTTYLAPTLLKVDTTNFGYFDGNNLSSACLLLGSQTMTDGDVTARVKLSVAGANASVVMRSNALGTIYYRLSLSGGILECSYMDPAQTSGRINLYQSASLGLKANTAYRLRFRIIGSQLQGRYWIDGTTEPSDFTNAAYAFTITDTSGTALSSGQFGLRARCTGSSQVINFDSFVASSIGSSGGGGGGGGTGTPQLTGAFSPLASATVNLTTEGAADWAHWNGTLYDHKSSGGSQVSNLTTVGNGSAQVNPSALNTFTWSDGTPDASGNTATGATIVAAATGTSGAPGAAGRAAPPHVMIVALENHSYDSFTGAGNAFPHINSLISAYGNCTKFYGITHQSVGNYFALVSGSDQGVTVDYTIPSGSVIAGNTIANSFDNAVPAIGWKHYAENLPSSGYLGADTGGYIQHHDPWVYFKPFRNASTAYQQAHIVSLDTSPTFTNLATELSNGVAPPFIFIQPNNNDNGHTGTDTSCDNWVNAFVAMATASTWYTANNGIIILWCDEGHPDSTATEGIGDLGSNGKHGGQTLCVVISALNSANTLTTGLNTYGVLHAILNLYGLSALGKDAHTINGDLTPLFTGNVGGGGGGGGGGGTTTSNLGNGFKITLPADTNTRTLNVYGDVNQGIATFAASLSDGSAPDLYDSTLSNKTAASAGVYALTYAAANPNQSLSVYLTLSDGTTPGTTKSSDTFTRGNQSNLGTSSGGETYQLVTEAGSPAWSILSNQAKLAGSTGDTSVALLGSNTLLDCESAMIVDLSNLADSAGLVLRASGSAASYYRATLTGSSIVLAYVTGGVSTILNSQPASLKTNTFYWLRFRILKNSLYARYWPNDGTKEPKNWHVFAVDRTIETAGQYGFRGVIGATSDTILWDTYSIVDLSSNNDPSYVSLYAADLPTGIATASGALSVTSSTPSGTIDVTSEGTGDWAHWGLPSATSFDHKANVTQLVSTYTNVGSGTYTQNTAALLAWSWEDGLVTPTVVASTTETDVTQVGNGFSFSLPADTNSRQVFVYVSAIKAQGKLIATLSDGSAASITDTSLNDVGTGSVLRYAITYNAASANQTLTIQWVMLTDNGTSGGATNYSIDSFTRANNASSWGSASDGTSGAWVQTIQSGTPTVSIASNKGKMTSTNIAVMISLLGSQTQANAESLVRFSISNLTNDGAALILRATSSATFYRMGIVTGTTLTFTRRVAGTDTALTPTATVTVATGTLYWLRFRINGSNLYGKFWADGTTEPTAWTITTTDSGAGAITGAGQWGLRTRSGSGDSILYDSYSVTNFGAGGGTPGSIGLDAASVPLVVVQGPPPPPPPPPSVNATFTVNANNAITPQAWIGLGVQQDAYTQGTGSAITISSAQRTAINQRINYMNPSLIRTCADAVSWWCPSGVVGTYDFYNATMQEWYQVFENAQQNNINVIVGVNSPAPFAALSADWATAFAALIDQLVNNSGYTCVKYVSGLSEPDTM